MKLTIKTIQTKPVKTKYGDKDKYLITFVERPDQLVNCFVGGWNGGWGVGTQIEVSQDQWESREYQGKTYWTLRAPASARFQGVSYNDFNALKDRVDILEQRLESHISEDTEKVFDESGKIIPDEPDELATDEDMVRDEDVPF